MPTLSWASKTTPTPFPAELIPDSIIYPGGLGYPDSIPDNQLILGDNLTAMSSLLPHYENRIDLIYADPPFFTNRHFSARVGRGEDSRKPQEWQLEEGYPDHWLDLDAYLDMLYPRLALMHRLLSPTGTFYLHLDWHADAYARLLLDEIFGSERMLNEIIWIYHGPSPIRSAFNRKHDTILVYTKGEQYTFNADAIRQPYDPVTVKTFASSPKAGFGKVPDLERGKVPEDWWYFPVVARLHNERTGYPTQKPEALLNRILLASSNPGDLVADFFCGSGTSAVAAQRLGRRFIASDITWRAIHTTRNRLVSLPASPFSLSLTQQTTKTYESLSGEGGNKLVQRQTTTLSIHPDLLPELDYWEIDPAWDGQIFHSFSQAARPLRKAHISPSLPLPPSACINPGSSICVRLVKINGQMMQVIL